MSGLPRGVVNSQRPSVARGQVLRAPSAFTDSLFVTLVNYSSQWEYEVPAGQWQAADLPEAGATCVVLLDDTGDAFVPLVVPST